jgi:voltage-gated potassium channel
MKPLLKRLLPIGIFIVVLLVIWTTIYYFLGQANGAHWSFMDCFYMTIMHIAPRAVTEALPNLGLPGRFITLVLIFIGLGAGVYLVSQLTSFIIEGRFSELYRRKAMLKQIAKLKNHFIICGANKIAQQSIAEMMKRQINFVVVEPDHAKMQEACALGNFFHIEGDPTEDETLTLAGIKVAKGMLIVMPSDETNLYITFTARELNPHIRIISRVAEAAAASRLTRAGAHQVVNPDYIGGLRMVSEAIRPSVTSFLDIMMRDTHSAYRFDESTVQKGSSIENKTLDEADVHGQSGALVLALAKPGHHGFIYNPPGNTVLEVGTSIVTLADIEQSKKLKQLTCEMEAYIQPVAE